MKKLLVLEKKHIKSSFYKQIKEFLSKNNACYVLLTCSEPSESGDMKVEMSFDGDKDLACYILDIAKNAM